MKTFGVALAALLISAFASRAQIFAAPTTDSIVKEFSNALDRAFELQKKFRTNQAQFTDQDAQEYAQLDSQMDGLSLQLRTMELGDATDAQLDAIANIWDRYIQYIDVDELSEPDYMLFYRNSPAPISFDDYAKQLQVRRNRVNSRLAIYNQKCIRLLARKK